MSRTSAIGTWCERHESSTGSPSTSFGPVQPFGVRRTIIGQRGRSARLAVSRALRWIARDLVERVVERGGEALVDGRRILAVEAARDEDRPVAVALEQRRPAPAPGIRARTVGFAIL